MPPGPALAYSSGDGASASEPPCSEGNGAGLLSSGVAAAPCRVVAANTAVVESGTPHISYESDAERSSASRAAAVGTGTGTGAAVLTSPAACCASCICTSPSSIVSSRDGCSTAVAPLIDNLRSLSFSAAVVAVGTEPLGCNCGSKYETCRLWCSASSLDSRARWCWCTRTDAAEEADAAAAAAAAAAAEPRASDPSAEDSSRMEGIAPRAAAGVAGIVPAAAEEEAAVGEVN
jgi:hypothetical protein